MCEHLTIIETELKEQGIKETFRGKAWSNSSGEWTYFDCYIDYIKLKHRLNLPDFVKHHTNDDNKSGLEDGLVCEKCGDAIMGYHRKLDMRKDVFTLQ